MFFVVPCRSLLPCIRAVAPFVLVALLIGGCAGKSAVTVQKGRLEQVETYSAEKSGDALLIWVEDSLVLETYQNGYDPERPHALTELSALLPSLAALATADEEVPALDRPASTVIEEWAASPAKAEITLSQLLHFTAGLKPDGIGRGEVPTFEDALSAPLVHSPGEGFRFGPTPIQVLGAMMERSPNEGLMKEHLFRPLGIPGGRWTVVGQEASVSPRASGLSARLFDGAHLKARELGRIGRMLLRGGRWDGETILEDTSPLTEPAPAAPGYGIGVWLNTALDSIPTHEWDAFRAQVPERLFLTPDEEKFIYDGASTELFVAAGRYNQRLYVFPSREMVVVRFGRADRTWSDRAFLRRLLSTDG